MTAIRECPVPNTDPPVPCTPFCQPAKDSDTRNQIHYRVDKYVQWLTIP